MTLELHDTENPISNEERLLINENWQRIKSGYSYLQQQIKVLAGGAEVDELIQRLNEAVDNANVAVQEAIDANNTATQEAIEANNTALQTALDTVSQTLVNVNKAIADTNTATTEANAAKQGALDATAQAQTAINTMQSLINNMKHQGVWSNTTQYYKNNMVVYNGSTFIALQDSLGKTPPTLPTQSNAYWSLFAEKGTKGDKGEKGDAGTGVTIIGSLPSESELPTTGNLGDAYLIDGYLYVWNGANWENVGKIQGPQGEIGPLGPQGEQGLPGKDADLTEINQKVDDLNTEVTEHLAEIATTENLGHFKPDGETLEVDPVTGVAKVIGGVGNADLYQEGNIVDDKSSAIGYKNMSVSAKFAGKITSTDNVNKIIKMKYNNGLAVGDVLSLILFDEIEPNVTSKVLSITSTGNSTNPEFSVKLENHVDLTKSYVKAICLTNNTGKFYQLASGKTNVATGNSATALGYNSISAGSSAFSAGDGAQAIGGTSVALGSDAIALGGGSTALGLFSIANGSYSIAQGNNALSNDTNSIAFGSIARAMGFASIALGSSAFAGSNNSICIGQSSARGRDTIAMGSFAEADGIGSIAIGDRVKAVSDNSIAMGIFSKTEAKFATAIGMGALSNVYGSTAIGVYNKSMSGFPNTFDSTGDAFAIGNTSNENARSNAFRVRFNGNTYGYGGFNSSGADYAEYFEWMDGNPREQDRVGYVVTLDKGKIRKATPKDTYILGIVSATPSVIGDSFQDDWNGKYLTDEWGRVQYEWIEIDYEEKVEVEQEDGSIKIELITKTRKDYVMKMNPNWNPDQEYTPREERHEWDAVGLVGKLLVRDDGTIFPNNFAKVGALDGELTLSENPTNIRVMERVTPNIVRVFIK